MKIKIKYFFRKPFEGYHSIEELFLNIQNNLPSNIEVRNYTVKYYSKGILNRILNGLEVFRFRGELCHVTGDIHYITLFLRRRSTILTIHDLVPLSNVSSLKRLFIKLFWYYFPVRHLDFITVISEFTKRELLKYIPVNEDKIHVIYNPVSSLIRAIPKAFSSQRPKILQVGTAGNKNLEGLIKAVKGLEVELIIIGKLSDKQILELQDIVYVNYVDISFEQVINCYYQSDLVFFGSLYEGFGLPIVEAQAAGRPVITSNLASMPEIAGKGARFVDPYSVEDIRRAVLEIIGNENLRVELINNGFENVKRFQASVISGQYAKLYERVYLSSLK